MYEVQTNYGKLTCPPWDNFIGASLREYGYYCNVEQKFHNQICGLFAATIKEPGLILDIGAHIGSMAVPMAHGLKQAPNEHVIVAIEPQPNNYAVLCHNLAQNDMLFTPVVPINAAIGPDSDKSPPLRHVPFLSADNPFNSGAVGMKDWDALGRGEGVANISVRELTVDELVTDLDMDLRRLLYVKADVEGTELDIIDQTTRRKGDLPVLFIECNTDKNLELAKTYLSNGDKESLYQIHWMAEPYYIETQNRKNIWNREIWSVNLMFIPKWFADSYAFQTDALAFSMDDTMESVINRTREVIRNAQK